MITTYLPSVLKSDAQKLIDLHSHLITKSKYARATNFKIGDRILVLEGYHDSVTENVTPMTTEFIAATVIALRGTNLLVDFDSGRNNWYLSTSGKVVSLEHLEAYVAKFSVPIDLDTSHLDKLVLDPQSKGEIINVLKQHKNLTKIFEEWGLSEIMEYGKAMSLLFYGIPGTGKTWGANCIAKALQKELLIISAAEIQTSEPGGANRNIQAAFKQAKMKGNVLFLDECDGLITDRSHVGMILASEINTLLTCLEQFDGVVIFATNRCDTLDPAMARRISLMVEFKTPDEKTRKDIWGVLLPKKMPLADDVSIEKLAKFDLTGGYIKNAILSAARTAAGDECDCVHMKHFAQAIKRIKETKDIMGTHTSRQQDFIKARA